MNNKGLLATISKLSKFGYMMELQLINYLKREGSNNRLSHTNFELGKFGNNEISIFKLILLKRGR
jgi:hypothetical protein